VPAAPAAAPLPPPAAFPEAVGRAGTRVFTDVVAGAKEPRIVVIDPLIDASTGQQTTASVQMGQQLAELVKAKAPGWQVQPLTRAALSKQPLLLIGTLTAISTKNPNLAASTEPADAFRICLRVADLRTGRVVARGLDRAVAASVDAEPTPFFRDSPTWAKDKTAAAYTRSCQGTAVGDPLDPAYLIRLPAAAVLNEALMAYGQNRMADAYRLYREAAVVAEPDDLRVLNGQYLTSWRTGRRQEAADAFGRIVQAGLATRNLPLKLLFAPGGTQLLNTGDLAAQYALWLRTLGGSAKASPDCLRIVGHTSRTGLAAANDALSLRRATFVQQRLEQQQHALAGRIQPVGVGSRENLIGLGTDDLRDALDRRVEFRVVDCRSGA
jgi:outer membrane protein OmpA-like peptidoglycan-associated protein